MYAWYKRIVENNKVRLVFKNQSHLAGCNRGLIATELKEILTESNNAPFGWELPIAEKWNKEGYSFIIDIKPQTEEIFLCEIDKVFGYSYEGWTPVMLRLKILCNDIYSSKIDKKNFEPQKNEIIYTMLYLYGSVKHGKIIDKWIAPFGTVTALLVWPEAMTFFFNQVQKHDPDFLHSEIKVLQPINEQ